MKKEEICLRHSFWGDSYDHNWVYENKEERICLKCGQKEIYFGESNRHEDWRKKYEQPKV